MSSIKSKEPEHIFFDLDHTLWDFEKNSHEALTELFEAHDLKNRGIPGFPHFFEHYRRHNDELWAEYRVNKVKKEVLRVERFKRAFREFDVIDDELAERMATDYLAISPRKRNLFPRAIETVQQLSGSYRLHIITNGFEEVQSVKMRETGLDKHFDLVITSEAAGSRKPDKGIFKYALDRSGAQAEQAVMIGDNPTVDLDPARELGMRTFHFHPFDQPPQHHHEVINELISLIDHL